MTMCFTTQPKLCGRREAFFSFLRRDLAWLDALPDCLRNPELFRTVLRLTHLGETGGMVLFSDKDMGIEEFCEYCRAWAPELIIEKYWRKT